MVHGGEDEPRTTSPRSPARCAPPILPRPAVPAAPAPDRRRVVPLANGREIGFGEVGQTTFPPAEGIRHLFPRPDDISTIKRRTAFAPPPNDKRTPE